LKKNKKKNQKLFLPPASLRSLPPLSLGGVPCFYRTFQTINLGFRFFPPARNSWVSKNKPWVFLPLKLGFAGNFRIPDFLGFSWGGKTPPKQYFPPPPILKELVWRKIYLD